MNDTEKLLKSQWWKDLVGAIEADYVSVCMNPNKNPEAREAAFLEHAALQRLKEKLAQKARE